MGKFFLDPQGRKFWFFSPVGPKIFDFLTISNMMWQYVTLRQKLSFPEILIFSEKTLCYKVDVLDLMRKLPNRSHVQCTCTTGQLASSNLKFKSFFKCDLWINNIALVDLNTFWTIVGHLQGCIEYSTCTVKQTLSKLINNYIL